MALLPELRERVGSFFKGFSDAGALERKGFQDFSFDLVSVGELYRRDGFNHIATLLDGGAGPSYSGETVSRQTTLSLSVAWAALRLMSECPALMPWEIYQRKGRDLVKRDDLPIYEVFHEGNDNRTSMDLRSAWMGHLLLEGNCYGQIVRRSGPNPIALDVHLIMPDQILPAYEKNTKANFPRIQYTVHQKGNSDKVFFITPGQPQDIFHCRGLSHDGLVGYNVIKAQQQTLGNSIAAQRHGGKFFYQGGRLPYVLETGQKFSPEDFARFRADWELVYQEPHRAAILPYGLQHKNIGVSAKDAQLLEFAQFSVFDICRVFGISPTMIGDLSKASYNSIYVLADQFVKFSLHPWLTRLEKTFRRCVLTQSEKDAKIFAKHNVNAILRGDFVTRMQGYAQMIQSGIASINEIREREDMSPIPNGDGHNQQMQMQPAASAGTAQTQDQIGLQRDLEDDEDNDD